MSTSVRSTPSAWRPLQYVVLFLVALLIWVLRPVLGALLLGGFAVLVSYEPYQRLVNVLHGRRATAAVLATAGLSVAILLPLAMAAYLAIDEAADGIRWITRELWASGTAGLLHWLPVSIRELLPSLTSTIDALLGWVTRSASNAPHLIASTGRLLIEALLTIVTMYYLFVEGPSFVDLLRRVSPLSADQTDALLAEFRIVALALLRGSLVVALFHGVSAAVGYAIFGVSRVLLFGVLTAAASIVPVIGTGLVWLPLVIGLALTHHVGQAAGLLIWCAAVVGFGDQLLRPIVSKGHMALPRLLVFLTVFGGLQMFGAKGLLLGPLLGSLAVTALRLLARQS
jgi:predicted PurR-regulated permease PerM